MKNYPLEALVYKKREIFTAEENEYIRTFITLCVNLYSRIVEQASHKLICSLITSDNTKSTHRKGCQISVFTVVRTLHPSQVNVESYMLNFLE